MGRYRKYKKKNSGSDIWVIAFFIFICVSIWGNGDDKSPSRIVQPTNIPPKIVYSKPTSTKSKSLNTPVSLRGCVISSTIRIRENPGTEFNAVGGLTSGTCFKILGRNKDGSWAYIVTEGNINGWVAAWLITVQGDIKSAPITSSIISFTPTPNLSGNQSPSIAQPTKEKNKSNDCHPAYTFVCIPSGRDLNCEDIPYNNFPVTGGDPFNFDGDGDGVGCE